jgi:hypothetical protein
MRRPLRVVILKTGTPQPFFSRHLLNSTRHSRRMADGSPVAPASASNSDMPKMPLGERFMQHQSSTKGDFVPEKQTLNRARRDAREGKSPSTQAGEFVREEMDHIREGKHGARSTKQAIAIGLSKARRAGVKLPTPKAGQAGARTRKQAARDLRRGRSTSSAKPSAKRSRATLAVLKKESRSAASPTALARQAKSAARKRSPRSRSERAKHAARTRRANQGSKGGSQ